MKLVPGMNPNLKENPQDWWPAQDFEEVEYCAECETEAYLKWDIRTQGFRTTCPNCGAKLMLCDACMHRWGDFKDDCDWCDTGCKFDWNGKDN